MAKMIFSEKTRANGTKKHGTVGNALTIILPVISGKEHTLRSLLTEIGNNIRTNSYISFCELDSVHFMRWVLIPPASRLSSTLLAFESNHDGTPEDHLKELVSKGSAGIHAIYRYCVDYPVCGDSLPTSERSVVVRFLLERTIPYSAFYRGIHGTSAKQIKGEDAIRNLINNYLTSVTQNERSVTRDPMALCRGAMNQVRADKKLSEVLDNADDSLPGHPFRLALGILGGLSALPVLVSWLLAIRVKEIFDEQTSQVSIPDDAQELLAREDLQTQNQLTHVVLLRSGLLRALSIRVVLGIINFLARNFFNRGNLGGISSIHFARWALIDGGRRLLFFSNYDGSWESYLGDFIDKASRGLTAVWSNTEWFPKSFFLLFKGATDEERFKAWARAHQVPTQVWYSAYPQLTISNILNNRKICAELRRGFDSDRQALDWLRRF